MDGEKESDIQCIARFQARGPLRLGRVGRNPTMISCLVFVSLDGDEMDGER